LGRYLEHSRVFWFAGGDKPEVFIGSADMMHRNLDRRIEVLVKLTDPDHIDQVTGHLNKGMGDDVSSWHLQPSGEWVRHATDKDGTPLPDIQNDTMSYFASKPRIGVKR